MSFRITGTSGTANRTGAANLGSTNNGTLIFWFRKEDSTTDRDIGYLTRSGGGSVMRIGATGQIKGGFTGDVAGFGTFAVTTNDWVGIALTRSAGVTNVYVYSGGTLTLVRTDSSSYSESNLSTLALGKAGAWSDGASGCYRYARYWTAVLDATDIQAEFEMTPSSGTPAARATNLYFSWPLATGTDTTDWSGNSRVPTLSGGSTSAEEPTIGGGTAPTITDAGDEAFYNGETGVVITGTNFGATQGAGSVILSPTDNPADAGAVAQTVTSWGATSITITVVKGALSLDTNLYLFVTNGSAEVNAAGYVVQIQARVFVRETLIDKSFAALPNETGIVMLVWRQEPTTGSPNPDQAITVATDASGNVDQAIARGSLALNNPIWVAFFKDGTPARTGILKIIPDYE